MKTFRFCDGANWQVLGGGGSASGGQLGAGSFQFTAGGSLTCDDSSVGLMYYSAGFLRVCQGASDGWEILVAKYPCGNWQTDMGISCSSTFSGTVADRDTCESICESGSFEACEWTSSTTSCRRGTSCGGLVPKSGSEASVCVY